MVLVAGGTGRLGTRVVDLLTKHHMRVRVLTRARNRAAHLTDELIEVVEGDVRNPASLVSAFGDVTTVISSIQGLDDPTSSPEATDRDGNRNLINAAKASGVDHFVLVSVMKTSPDHPMSIGRAKYAAEQYLKASGLAWTIVRGTAYMEFWAQLVGQPLIDKGRTQVFGRGNNPINFVSADDVAKAVEMAVVDPGLRGVDLEVGGPENLTMNQVVEIFERMTGKKGKVSHVPLAMMRIMSVAMRPVKPAMARVVQAGVVMDTSDIMAWEPPVNRQAYPWLTQTPLMEVIQKKQKTPA
jgi:NADH dehydrogenase